MFGFESDVNATNFGDVSQETSKLLANVSMDLVLPSIYQFLPHLLRTPHSLQPAFKLAKGRNSVSMVLGIPTVKRDVQSYLFSTLENLISNMSPAERLDTVIIVFIAEVDPDYVKSQIETVKIKFKEHVDTGLLEVISPPASYYPDFTKLKRTIGDDMARVKWRTKQTLDFSFLMMYAQSRGRFFVQLEDDIVTVKNYITSMKEFAHQQISAKKTWLILDFCQLGFIGKLFQSSTLGYFVNFFIMFYNDKPVDWLLDHFIQVKYCRFDKKPKQCKQAKEAVWINYKTSLFQHIGTHSSLKGKVQKLKDKKFGKVPLFQKHDNPPAEALSSVKEYKAYTIQKIYKGENYFWGLAPHAGDQISFKFTPPIRLARYLFKSGNAESPNDIVRNTTIEILPKSAISSPTANVTDSQYTIIGEFDSSGIAKGTVGKQFGEIVELRLRIRTSSTIWIIISEIEVVPEA
ncbi:MGAT4B (predicted) [Pycnogonum litorale]